MLSVFDSPATIPDTVGLLDILKQVEHD